jgi:Fe-S-cluster containining protein
LTFVPVPTTVRRADDLLPAARRLVDRASERFINDPEIAVSCRAGCSACCSQAVPVTRAEVRSIRDAIERLPETLRAVIAERITATSAALAAAGLDESTFTAAGDDQRARTAAAMKYFDLGVPCPLLEDGVCSIRADRPLACREYLVTSDPAFCADPIIESIEGRDGGLGTVVRIRSTTNVLAGFQQVSAAFGEDRNSVLAFALARPRAEPPAAETQSGPQLAQLLV